MDALIVGAGPSGLTMAFELALHGIDCRVIEKRLERSRESRALGVQARTLEIFHQLGIVDEALAVGHQIRGGTLYGNNRPIANVTLSQVKSPYPFVLSLPQAETERILERRLAELGVSVERGVELTDLAATDTSAVATLGTRNESVEARWVIGCDGAHSTVRTLLGIPFTGASFKESFMLADIRGISELDRDRAHIFLSGDGVLVAIPLPENAWRLVTDHALENSSEVQPKLEDVIEVIAERAPDAIRAESAIWLSFFRIHRRLADSMRYGPCFLVGDAAHVHSPAGGQGMNTGIQDAHNLGWKLAYAVRGIARSEILDSYQPERHPIARGILRSTTAATRIATLRPPVLRALRNRGASLVGKTSLPDRILPPLVAETAVHYRGGPITDGTSLRLRTRKPRAGDRTPDVRFRNIEGEGKSLLDYLRPTQFTLLFLCTETSEQAERLILAVKDRFPRLPLRILLVTRELPERATQSSETVFDKDLDLQEGLDARGPSVILIRPDGYIAHRSEPIDPDAVIHYLDSLFL